jgi:hypothetical protein
LLELEISELFLTAKWVRFPFDVVQLQLMLQLIALLLLLEPVQLPLHLVELLHAEGCHSLTLGVKSHETTSPPSL